MPFLEDADAYKTKVEKFMREHPGATLEDVDALFPRMNDPTAIWSRFNGSAVAHAKAQTKAGAVKVN